MTQLLPGKFFHLAGAGNGYLIRKRVVLRMHFRELSGYVVHWP